jgi:crotonobetainyl-CoA:carnitine CoA-transferase CaiB-like acyl-CoA transferase
MLSLTGFGMTGPYKDYVAYGNISEAMAGLVNLHGYPDGPPVETPFPYNDCLSAIHGAALLIGALHQRRRTGRGLHLDFSESELTLHVMHQALFDWLLNKREQTRQGNRDDAYPVHDIFRSKGDDAWVAIAARSDIEWRGLCKAMGRDDWLLDGRFTTHEGRMAHRDELESHVSMWALALTPQESAERLQGQGVPAGPAYHIEQIMGDPHVAARGVLMPDTHRYTKGRILASPPLRTRDLPSQHRLPAPCLGEHNDDVFGRLLSVEAAEIARLKGEQVFL